MKNLNSIVWLYRGETEKYTALLKEYHSSVDSMVASLPAAAEELAVMLEEGAATHLRGNIPAVDPSSDFANYKERLEWEIEVTKRAVQQTFDMTKVRSKKTLEIKRDEFISTVNDVLTVIREYEWLKEKFGDGVYADVLGLCKVAVRADMIEKSYSLTPGAYVGVAPVKSDGVNFEKRMTEIHRDLLSLQEQNNNLMQTISQNLKEMGL